MESEHESLLNQNPLDSMAAEAPKQKLAPAAGNEGEDGLAVGPGSLSGEKRRYSNNQGLK